MTRRTSQVVDDDSKTLLPHECLGNKHPPTLQRGMPVMLQVQMIGAQEPHLYTMSAGDCSSA